MYNDYMDRNTTLLLIETNEINDIFYSDWLANGYNADVLFKKVNKLLRAIRRYWLKLNMPFSYIWYGDWYKEIDKYNCIIIYSSKLTRYMPFVLNKRNSKLRIINWYWNTVDNETKPIKTDIKNIEYWSFDGSDCKEYGMKQNIQYYCPQENINCGDIENDIYFVGRDKGREETINNIKDIATKQNLKCNFNIVYGNSLIPYKEVRKEIVKSRAILEINKENQSGLTLRSLESLFYRKKLITNNISIMNYNFYNQDNIFIIGKDNIDELDIFVNRKYNNSADEYIKEYDLEKWFNNFNDRN